MPTLEELKQQLETIQAEIKKLESAPKEWPQKYDRFFVVDWDGDCSEMINEGDQFDTGAKAIGNMYRTEAEALMEIEARKVAVLLKSQPGCRKFVVGEDNYHILLHSSQLKVDYGQLSFSAGAGWRSIYFDSLESVKVALETVGEKRIIKAIRWDDFGEVNLK